MSGIRSVLPQLCLEPALGRPDPQLQTQLIAKPACSLRIDFPTFPQQQHMNSPIAGAHVGLADLLEPEVVSSCCHLAPG